jgi:hypothetical protein
LNIKTSIIDLESIKTPEVPTEDVRQIEALANSIIELGGLLHPPILRILGIDEYEVLSGQLEFYAYLQARQFDESLPDRLSALIVDQKNEAAVQKQLSTTELIAPRSIDSVVNDNSTLIAINNLDSKIERQLKTQNKSITDSYELAIKSLESKIDELFANQSESIGDLHKNLISQKDISLSPVLLFDNSAQSISLLAAFNRITDDEFADQLFSKLDFIGKEKSTKIRKILKSAKEPGKSFRSLTHVQEILTETVNGKRIKLIGDTNMLKAVDRWHQ